jgi:hypothetical protein
MQKFLLEMAHADDRARRRPERAPEYLAAAD